MIASQFCTIVCFLVSADGNIHSPHGIKQKKIRLSLEAYLLFIYMFVEITFIWQLLYFGYSWGHRECNGEIKMVSDFLKLKFCEIHTY